MTDLVLTHIGGPTMLIELAGWRLLTDPTFDPPGRKYAFGWGTSSTKLSGPALSPADVGPVDAVLLTHGHHADNLDDLGRELLRSVPVALTTATAARGIGLNARGLRDWQVTRLEAPGRPTIDVTATPCRHGPPLTRPIVGDVVGFALTSDALPDGALWVSGDTVLYDGVRQVADRIDVDIAVLHLGGVRFPVTGPLRYTMTIDEGVELCRLLAPRVAIPVHYEGWSHFRQGRTAVDHVLRERGGGLPFAIVPIGDATSLDTLLAGIGDHGGKTGPS
jgi:L-ascorbate metabolism protein UlaG (beta-lactamase superfamily)